ncbi:MAG: hypothetical protein HY317_03150 [Acidobacteria bacterium]|nr:hypothetical protein [Acidobacteriota bacterium]
MKPRALTLVLTRTRVNTLRRVARCIAGGPLSRDVEKGEAIYWTPRRILETLLDEPDKRGLIQWAMNWWPRPRRRVLESKRRTA